MEIDISQTLKDTENALRDFIAFTLSENLGQEWEEKCGVSADRISKWKERKEIENRKQTAGSVDERLIYYADFFDLQTIVDKQWEFFSPVFGDKKTMKVWLSELEKLRNPEAHRRELLPHQKHLILGISGEIRTQITRYRSQQETTDSYYPRIEFAADNLGNTWKIGHIWAVFTNFNLHPGDMLEFIVTASDPMEEPIEYQFGAGQFSDAYRPNKPWGNENTFIFSVTEDHIGNSFIVRIEIRSNRKFHARGSLDDCIEFQYSVLPPKVK